MSGREVESGSASLAIFAAIEARDGQLAHALTVAHISGVEEWLRHAKLPFQEPTGRPMPDPTRSPGRVAR
jgi:hypothetical protein